MGCPPPELTLRSGRAARNAATTRHDPGDILRNEPARGGHFAAWEQPGLFVGEVRAAARGCLRARR